MNFSGDQFEWWDIDKIGEIVDLLLRIEICFYSSIGWTLEMYVEKVHCALIYFSQTRLEDFLAIWPGKKTQISKEEIEKKINQNLSWKKKKRERMTLKNGRKNSKIFFTIQNKNFILKFFIFF